jgi:hypothetical protein
MVVVRRQTRSRSFNMDMLNQQVTNIRSELSAAQRSLQASRANVKREQERNLSLVNHQLQSDWAGERVGPVGLSR